MDEMCSYGYEKYYSSTSLLFKDTEKEGIQKRQEYMIQLPSNILLLEKVNIKTITKYIYYFSSELFLGITQVVKKFRGKDKETHCNSTMSITND